MFFHSYTILPIFIMVVCTVDAFAQYKTEWVLALVDSEVIFANGVRAELKKGSKIEHPSHFNGRDITVTLTGEASFEILRGFNFTVEYNEAIVKATGASFSIAKGEGTIEITATRGEVLIMAYKKQIAIRPYHKATCNTATKQIIVTDTRIKRT